MPQTNWARLIIGIFIASIIMFLTDGFFHERVVEADWKAVYASLGVGRRRMPPWAWCISRFMNWVAVCS